MPRLLFLFATTSVVALTTNCRAETYVQVSAGAAHTCALRTDGEIECWGRDLDGESSPPEGPFQQVVAGNHATCALRQGGEVECWGDRRALPRDLPGGEFAAIAMGPGGFVATDLDGERIVSFRGRSEPFELTGSAKVVVGEAWACALGVDGRVRCRAMPRQRDRFIAPQGPYTAIAVGEHHLCGIREADGGIACHGGGWHARTPSPRGRFTALASGIDHACAVRDDGITVCWGEDSWGQSSPLEMPFALVSCGARHSCGLTAEGEVRCWGDDRLGQVSRGDPESVGLSRERWKTAALAHVQEMHRRGSPRYCDALGGVPGWSGTVEQSWSILEAGRPARRKRPGSAVFTEPIVSGADGEEPPPGIDRCFDAYWSTPMGGEPFELFCRWSVSAGSMEVPYVCTATFSDEERAVEGSLWLTDHPPAEGVVGGGPQHSCSDVHGWSTPPAGRFTEVVAGRSGTCGWTEAGSLTCWGNCYEPLATPVSWSHGSGEGVFEGRSGIRPDGTFVAWDGFTPGVRVVPGPFLAVSSGLFGECYVYDGGELVCRSNSAKRPEPPAGVYRSVDVGSRHACGLTDAGEVVCWGADDAGQCDAPQGEFTRVLVGSRFSCAVRDDDTVECWGLISASRERKAPAEQLSSVTAGDDFACGLRDDGTPVCWGSCGMMLPHTANYVCESPCRPPAGARFRQISAGGGFTCGVTVDGDVRCWGYVAQGGPGPAFVSISSEGCYSPGP